MILGEYDLELTAALWIMVRSVVEVTDRSLCWIARRLRFGENAGSMPVSVKENNGDLFSEDNGFLDETFGNEWEIVR